MKNDLKLDFLKFVNEHPELADLFKAIGGAEKFYDLYTMDMDKLVTFIESKEEDLDDALNALEESEDLEEIVPDSQAMKMIESALDREIINVLDAEKLMNSINDFIEADPMLAFSVFIEDNYSVKLSKYKSREAVILEIFTRINPDVQQDDIYRPDPKLEAYILDNETVLNEAGELEDLNFLPTIFDNEKQIFGSAHHLHPPMITNYDVVVKVMTQLSRQDEIPAELPDDLLGTDLSDALIKHDEELVALLDSVGIDEEMSRAMQTEMQAEINAAHAPKITPYVIDVQDRKVYFSLLGDQSALHNYSNYTNSKF